MAGTKFNDSSDPAFEDALLAAAVVAAPPVAAAAAIIETGKDAVEFAGDAAGEVAGAFEDLFGGGDDVPPGTSTFPVDPNAPAPSETAEEANARGDDIRANQAHFNELGGGGGWVFNADPDVHTQVDNSLDLDSGIAGPGAAGGNAVGAPDGAYEPVSASQPHIGIGFIPEGADVGAPDDVFEPVSESGPAHDRRHWRSWRTGRCVRTRVGV